MNEETPITPVIEPAQVITVNFKDGEIVGKVNYDADGGIPKLFRDLAKYAKKHDVKSVLVLTITEQDHVDWVHIAKSEHHLALAALCIEDLKEDLKDEIFGVEEDDEE